VSVQHRSVNSGSDSERRFWRNRFRVLDEEDKESGERLEGRDRRLVCRGALDAVV
jgi:hypothetical protein